MPRSLPICVLIFVGGCFFEADYNDGGVLPCGDGRCPSGLTCNASDICVAAIDAGLDADADAAIDAREVALTCADPGEIPSAGGTVMGTTVDRNAVVSPLCGGFVMNGREAVYRITLAAGDQLLVSIMGDRKAYVIAQCVNPAPACLGNMFATQGSPISVTPAAGESFVIVDDENPAFASEYTLTLGVN
jgi:hypothetical protein